MKGENWTEEMEELINKIYMETKAQKQENEKRRNNTTLKGFVSKEEEKNLLELENVNKCENKRCI